MVTGGVEGAFFEEDESPEAVARLAAMFVNPPRFVRDEAHLVEVVRTLRRQSERKVREDIVADLSERLELLREEAWEKDRIFHPSDALLDSRRLARRAVLEELAYCIWMVRGFPGRGISRAYTPLEYPLGERHVVNIHGVPGGHPVGYEGRCSCGFPTGWSVRVIGAKRLARRHAGLM